MRTDRNTKHRKSRSGFRDSEPRNGNTVEIFKEAIRKWELRRFGVNFETKGWNDR